MGWFVVPFGETLSGSACGAGLHSAVCWVLESAFCEVQILLFSGASERGGILGESPQLKVVQCVVVAFAVFVQVQMHGVVCGAVR